MPVKVDEEGGETVGYVACQFGFGAWHEVDDVARAEEHEDVARTGRAEKMLPAFVERTRQGNAWGLSPEGGVEVCDVAAGNGFFKGRIDGGENHFVRRREGRRELVAQRFRARVAMGLEHDAQTGGTECACHVYRAFQLCWMMGVVGVNAHAV